MKKSAFLIISILFIITSCSSSAKQNYKLSDEEMANLLFDIHFADVILSEFSGAQRDSVKVIYWKRMTELYGLSEEEIREEITSLESEPGKMKLIIGRVKEMADSIQ